MPTFEPFRVDVPYEVLDDLRDRLRRTRFPNQVEGAGGTRAPSSATSRSC